MGGFRAYLPILARNINEYMVNFAPQKHPSSALIIYVNHIFPATSMSYYINHGAAVVNGLGSIR